MPTDLSEVKKGGGAKEQAKEGVRERERRVKQPSGSKVHRPLASAKGAARSSGLSTFCDKKALSQESPLSALLQDWGPIRKDSQLGAFSVPMGKLCPNKLAEDRAVAQTPLCPLCPTRSSLLFHPKQLRKAGRLQSVTQRLVHMLRIRGSIRAIPTPHDWVS